MKFTGKAIAILGLAALIVLSSAMDADAQGRGRGRGRGGRGGFRGVFGGGSVTGTLLTMAAVQKELEMVDDQVASVKKVQADAREKMSELFQNARRNGGFGGLREAMTKLNKETEKAYKEGLLPHQVKRLDQLAFQYRISRGGSTRAFTSGDIAKELGITDKQKEELRKLSTTLNAELQKMIAKFRAESTKKVLAKLTAEQRKKYETKAGKAFVFPQPQRRSFRGFGGRGGRGGARGGQRRRPGAEN